MPMAKWTYKKYMGDDIYSYAVFKDGRPYCTGMGRSEAKLMKERKEREQSNTKQEA